MVRIREAIIIEEDNLKFVHTEDVLEVNGEKYKFVEENATEYDSEKGSQSVSFILRRESDGKYFQFRMTYWSAGGRSYKTDGTEVFPKTITTIIYD